MLAGLERGEFEGIDRHWIEESARRMAEEPDACAVAVDGDAVAGWVYPHHDDLHVDLPYRKRGHGRRLVEAGRILAPRAGYPFLRLWVPRTTDAEAFARSVGLHYHSSLLRLVLDRSAVPVPPAFADDVVVRWLIPGEDDAAFGDLVNEIFLDHPYPLVLDLERIRRVHARRDFDPSSILLVAPAADPAALVGFCRVGAYHDDDGRLVGEVKLLGVRRPWRGRGLARQLLRWGIEACGERGVEETYLAVEGENERAMGLYEDEGFRRVVEWPHWAADPLPA
jgi:mycothiol synthase